MKMIDLNNSMKIPSMGLGTWGIGTPEEVTYESIKLGTRLIDTASAYKNEEAVGKGINRAIAEGIVKREDLFVVTKCFIDERHDPLGALKNSLKRLNLSYVDLYLDHWPTHYSYGENTVCPRSKMVPMHIVWENMEKCVENGLTKSIGVSNYNVQSLCNLLSFCKILPVVNEVEFHPYCYQKNLLHFCNKENIKVLSYCPLVKGKSGQKGENVFEEEVIKNLAKKYERTEGQIILNWHLKVGVIPIPGTSNKMRMKENFGAFDFELANEDIEAISKLTKGFRICDGYSKGRVAVFE